MSNKPAAKTAGYFNTSRAASNRRTPVASVPSQLGKSQKTPPPPEAPAPVAKAAEAAAVATFRVPLQGSEIGVKPAPVATTEYTTSLSDSEIAELLQAFNKRCSIERKQPKAVRFVEPSTPRPAAAPAKAEVVWSQDVVFTDVEEDLGAASVEAEEDFKSSSIQDQNQVKASEVVERCQQNVGTCAAASDIIRPEVRSEVALVILNHPGLLPVLEQLLSQIIVSDLENLSDYHKFNLAITYDTSIACLIQLELKKRLGEIQRQQEEIQRRQEEIQKQQEFVARELALQVELHRQEWIAAQSLPPLTTNPTRGPAIATLVSSSKKPGIQKYRIEKHTPSIHSPSYRSKLFNFLPHSHSTTSGKFFLQSPLKRSLHAAHTQHSIKRSKKNKLFAPPKNSITPLRSRVVTNIIRKHKEAKTYSLQVGPYYSLELPKDWKPSPYPNPRKRSYQDFVNCQDQPKHQVQSLREHSEVSTTLLIKGPYKFRVWARFTAKWPKSLPARTRSQRKGTYICDIDLKGDRYGVTTMLTAKRLCVESLNSITAKIEHAQQAMFGRERNETRIDAQTTNRSGELTIPETNQNDEADRPSSDEKKETDSIQDFEWDDNPELNKPTKLSLTKSRDEMKEEFKDDSDNEPTEKPSPKPKDESPTRTYEDVQNIGLASLLLDDENEKSPLRLELSERRAELRSKEQAERERKAQEERERKILEQKLQAERLGRIEPSEGLFQELSDELEQLVERAINTHQPHKQLCLSFEGTPLHGQDFHRLRPGVWLNDEIINAFIGLNVQQIKQDMGHKRKAIPMVEMFVSNFYSNLEVGQNTNDDAYSKVKRWASRKFIGGQDFLKCNLIITPVNLGNSHWTLLAFWPKHRVVEFYNSFRDEFTSRKVLNLAKEYVKGELGSIYIDSEWNFRPGKSPEQHNGCDCGVFVCTTAKCLLLGYEPELSYTGANMAEQRKRIAAELLKGDLIGELKMTRADGWLKQS